MADVDFSSKMDAGDFNVTWIHGSQRKGGMRDPPIQVHYYDQHTVIMRESKDVSFEAPFLYLFFGNKKALLVDTGATGDSSKFPLRSTVDGIMEKWLAGNHHQNYELIIVHTHGHNDHTSGDVQFVGRPNTTIVSKDVDSVKAFFGIGEWPQGSAEYDLGGRVLDVFPIPGHDPRSISIFDRYSGFLLTSDTVCRGRLYISDFPSFLASLERLVSFSKENHVKYIMGSHVEMSRKPRHDYPATARFQPDEPQLQMSVGQLETLMKAAEEVKNKPGAHKFNDFIIFNGPCYGAVVKQLIRGIFYNLKYRLRS